MFKTAWFKNARLRNFIVGSLFIGLLIPVSISSCLTIYWENKKLSNNLEEFHSRSVEILAANMREPIWDAREDFAMEIADAFMQDQRIVGITVTDLETGTLFLEEIRENGQIGNLLTKKAVVLHEKQVAIGEVTLIVTDFYMKEQLREYSQQLIFIFGTQLILGLLLLLPLIYEKILRPLSQLRVQAEKLSNNELDTAFCWEQGDEFGLVGKTFERARTVISSMIHELQSARIKAESAGEEKSLFLANISHELRTPLNAIIGLSHLTLQTSLARQQRDYVNNIDVSAKKLLRLLGNTLDFSKIEAGKLELEDISFSPQDILNKLNSLLHPQCEAKEINFSLDVAKKIPVRLLGDALRLEQILINLGSNAVKFTHNGKISVVADIEKETEHDVILRFSFIDTGVGLSQDQVDDLFQPFHQADASTTRNYGGTGLGLAICKRLVEMMGGEIIVTSALGKGSTFSFTVRLDKAKNDHVVVPNFSMNQAKSLLAGYRILLVEDNEINQHVAYELLQKVGIEVVSVRTGIEAINATTEDSFDAILMDLQMPEMDGFRATAEIRKYYSSSELPIMAMTADVQKETREKCLATGMNDYISKPIEPSFLYEKLIHQLRPDVEPELVTKTTDLGKQVFDIEKIPRLHGVNPKLSLINMDHNAELYRKILRRVFKDYHDRGKDIHQNLLMGDYKTAGQLTHTIKGVFGTLGAEQLYGVAGDLEQAIITADIERIAHLITIFTYNFEKFMYSLENFILQEQDSFTDTEALKNLATAPQF